MDSIQQLLQQRYYWNGENTWEQLARRVSTFLIEDPTLRVELYKALWIKDFVPSSPVLMNAGSGFPMLHSCFVLPVEDDIVSIMKSLSDTVFIQKYGGGVGLNFSHIRPEGSLVSTTHGVASGPVSFMGFWNEAMNVIRQGGKRQGALMGVLNWNHPDIDLFINAKSQEGALTNFNLSVALDKEFWRLVRGGDAETNRLFYDFARHAWENGEPGFLFMDNINERNPYGVPIEATNPCGEVPLPPYGACCLGSINLNAVLMPVPGTPFMQLDEEEVKRLTRLGVDALNAVIDKSAWPIPEAEAFMLQHRPIGLGVMGLADMLARMGLAYDSCAAIVEVDRLFSLIKKTARDWSDYRGYNNATVLSIAPTGSVAMLARASYSIEPYFHIAGTKSVESGTYAAHTWAFPFMLDRMGVCLTGNDRETINATGSVQHTSLPPRIKAMFRTANEMSPKAHLAMQSVVQGYVDNAVSKTINLPKSATIDDIQTIIADAYFSGIKGLTMYRDKSRETEVFTAGCATGTCDL